MFGAIRPTDPFAVSTGDELRTSSQPISISVSHTVVGISLLVSFALLLLGTARLLSSEGGLSLAQPLIAFGILLSIIGIGQYALTLHDDHPLIYGLWKPQFEAARPFGPFVNPNHFAGWMLMVLPIALALCYAALERTLAEASMVSLPEFGRAVTFGFCLGRDGALARHDEVAVSTHRAGRRQFSGALWVVVRRQRSLAARAAVVGVFLVVVGGAGAWAGVDTLADEALNTDTTNDSFGGRLGAWRDARRIIAGASMDRNRFQSYGTAMTIYQTGHRDVHFQEAHNDYLQLAAEGGLLVGIPILATLAIFIRDVRRRFRESPPEEATRTGSAWERWSAWFRSVFNRCLISACRCRATPRSGRCWQRSPFTSHRPVPGAGTPAGRPSR